MHEQARTGFVLDLSGEHFVVPNLFGDDGEIAQAVRSERRDHWHVGGIAPPGNENAANPRAVVPSVERVPPPANKCLEPGIEVHWRGIRGNADVAQIAIAITGRDVEATTKGDGEVREVAAYAYLLFHSFVGCPRRLGGGIAELQTAMDIAANRLNARPPIWRGSEGVPGEFR